MADDASHDATLTGARSLSPERIRALRAEAPNTRARDFAQQIGVAEAELLAADVGRGVTAIAAHPDQLIARVPALGDVMALTRNDSCVIERVGRYDDYRSGGHAQLVAGDEIDLRFFSKHWVYAFATTGEKRSLQVFDAAGDAVHKIFLRPESDAAAFDALVTDLALAEQADGLALSPRAAPEAAKSDAAKADALRAAWAELTDTHQFLTMVSRLKMNRLGAYRIAGADLARPLAPVAVRRLFERASADALPIMVFVGNQGCIEIHSGPVVNIVDHGPWLNVMDPRLNIHLREDHIAEVWQVEKPTRHGPVLSVEFFDARGALIAQIFGSRKLGRIPDFDALARSLPAIDAAEAAE